MDGRRPLAHLSMPVGNLLRTPKHRDKLETKGVAGTLSMFVSND